MCNCSNCDYAMALCIDLKEPLPYMVFCKTYTEANFVPLVCDNYCMRPDEGSVPLVDEAGNIIGRDTNWHGREKTC